MKLLSIDVGLVNMGMCILSSSQGEHVPSLSKLQKDFEAGTISIVDWRVVQLAPTKKAPASVVFDAIIKFFNGQDILCDWDVVVIETQMSARMKALAACIYGVLKCKLPQSKVFFQSASAKLNFADSAAYIDSQTAPTSTYAQRKKTAVTIVSRLVTAVSPTVSAIFLRAKKKDDLADSLLHGLAGLCIHLPAPVAPKPRAAVKRPQSPAHGAST